MVRATSQVLERRGRVATPPSRRWIDIMLNPQSVRKGYVRYGQQRTLRCSRLRSRLQAMQGAKLIHSTTSVQAKITNRVYCNVCTLSPQLPPSHSVLGAGFQEH